MTRLEGGEGSRIGVTAICVFRHEGRILVASGRDSVTGQRFMRPLGGQVEFGERAVEAIEREIREEIQAGIGHPVLLGVLENVYLYEGVPGHQVVFVFDAQFRDRELYRRAEIPIAEDVWTGPARWVALASLSGSGTPLYPEGLLALLLDAEAPPRPTTHHRGTQ